MATTSNRIEQQAVTPPQQKKRTQLHELLSAGLVRDARMPDFQKAVTAADKGIVTVGTASKVTVCYNSDLGPPGLSLAQQFLARALSPHNDMEVIFGISGGPVIVRICKLSTAHDGTGGGLHFGCNFDSGGTLFLDATFGNTIVNPLDLLVAIYIAELSEAFMGAQRSGWSCASINNESLSRFLAEHRTSLATMNGFATPQTRLNTGSPDWAVVYLYYMRWLGFTIPEILEAGGTTLAANFLKLSGNSAANPCQEISHALTGRFITSDSPFPPRFRQGQLKRT